MQTFLPYPDFAQSAKCLDYRRLGKQRVEAKQILMVLNGETLAWQNHPAVRMWRGYKGALIGYAITICDEWISRGYVDNLRSYFIAATHQTDLIKPSWLGNPDFHKSHQSNLVRKLPGHYGHLFPGVPNNLPYIWPVN